MKLQKKKGNSLDKGQAKQTNKKPLPSGAVEMLSDNVLVIQTSDLNSDSQYPLLPTTVVHTYNPRAGEAEMGTSLGLADQSVMPDQRGSQ